MIKKIPDDKDWKKIEKLYLSGEKPKKICEKFPSLNLKPKQISDKFYNKKLTKVKRKTVEKIKEKLPDKIAEKQAEKEADEIVQILTAATKCNLQLINEIAESIRQQDYQKRVVQNKIDVEQEDGTFKKELDPKKPYNVYDTKVKDSNKMKQLAETVKIILQSTKGDLDEKPPQTLTIQIGVVNKL